MVAAVGALRPRAPARHHPCEQDLGDRCRHHPVATLLLPVAAAVGIGVALSLLLQVNQEAMDLRVVQLLPVDGGLRTLADRPSLGSHQVSIFDVYGSVLYAGSRTLQALLPDPRDIERPAVVLRLRGRAAVGATFMVVLADYADRLGAVGGRLYLSGLSPDLAARLSDDPILAGHDIRFFRPRRGSPTRRARPTPRRRSGSTADGFGTPGQSRVKTTEREATSAWARVTATSVPSGTAWLEVTRASTAGSCTVKRAAGLVLVVDVDDDRRRTSPPPGRWSTPASTRSRTAASYWCGAAAGLLHRLGQARAAAPAPSRAPRCRRTGPRRSRRRSGRRAGAAARSRGRTRTPARRARGSAGHLAVEARRTRCRAAAACRR